MKIIAYYLPQFHRIPENDEWWGEGFTEWTNVKKGEPLFKNHYQPHVPLESYYSLEDKNTVIWQTEIAKKYGVYGFAYYHYWFEGKLLLEKPIRNLLAWKDIDQKFFFFWANHNWIKSIDGKQSVLIKQTYGEADDWRRHYLYFRQYFFDDRYIKIDNKPVIGIYILKSIPNADKMIELWNQAAIDDGFSGVYIIESTNYSKNQNIDVSSKSDAIVIRQPNAAAERLTKMYARIKKHPGLQKKLPWYYPFRVDYKKLCDRIITSSKKIHVSKKVYFGAFTGWDNTSRHSKRGWVVTDISPREFARTIREMKKLTTPDDFLFINAWNEWAEGMHLEPDEKNGYGFLEALQE